MATKQLFKHPYGFTGLLGQHTTRVNMAATYTNTAHTGVNGAPTANDGYDCSTAHRFAFGIHTLTVGGGTYSIVIWVKINGNWIELYDSSFAKVTWTGKAVEAWINDINVEGADRVYLELSAFTVTTLDTEEKVY